MQDKKACDSLFSEREPCQYSIGTLKGFGLWADDVIKYFADLIKRSIPQRSNESPKFPHSPPELASELMKGSISILLNTIFTVFHDRIKNNEFGYTFANFFSFACKIWALAND